MELTLTCGQVQKLKKMVKLPLCNILLKGLDRDINGNTIVKIKIGKSRGFSIQTNGVLERTEYILKRLKTPKYITGLPDSKLVIIGKEICSYLEEHGSDKQKLSLANHYKNL